MHVRTGRKKVEVFQLVLSRVIAKYLYVSAFQEYPN